MYCEKLVAEVEAPSTRIRIFLKTHIYLSVLTFRPHVAGVFGDENGAFRKRSPGWRFLKTPFSCSRVDGENESFRKRWRHELSFARSISQTKDTPEAFKMADKNTIVALLSLLSSLFACLELYAALFNLKNIIIRISPTQFTVNRRKWMKCWSNNFWRQ